MRKINSKYWGFIMLGFLFNSATASQEYPQLFENKVSSDNYEIVKLIDGPIDSLYSINSTGAFIAQSNSKLWKINAQGEVIDFLYPDHFYASGLILEKEGFIDWVFTGDKQIKPYGETIDARNFSEQQLFDLFDNTDAIEFVEEDETKGFAYLYKQGKVSILDISNHAEKIDDFYATQSAKKTNLRREETDIRASEFENYKRKNNHFSFLPHIDKQTSTLRSMGFDKVATHREMSITSTFFENLFGKIFSVGSSRDYGYPVGYTKYELSHQNETLKFSIFSDKEYGSDNAWNFSLLAPKTGIHDLKFMTVNYRRHYLAELNEMSLLPYYEKDVGLYVARKKTLHNQVNALAWHISYSGLHSYDSIWGHISFDKPSLDPVYYWFWQSRPIPAAARADTDVFGRRAEIASPVLKTIPKSISFHWKDFKRDRNFRLVVRNRDAEFYKPDDTQVALTLYFDAEEIKHAFATIKDTSDTIQINLDLQERDFGGELIVSLKSRNKNIILNNVDFDYQEIAYAPKSAPQKPGKMQTDLFSAYEESFFKYNPDKFLEKVNQLKQQNEVTKYAASLGYYFANLSLILNIKGRYPENNRLFDQYFAIHQDINRNPIDEAQHKNLMILASQGIYLGLNSKNQNLSNKIIKLFVDHPGFDLAKETNRSFLFNIACYYATHKNKAEMLQVIRRAIDLGKNPQEFLKDTDFTAYWQDADFLKALEQK